MPDQTGWNARGSGSPGGFTASRAAVSGSQHIVYGIDVGLAEAGIVLATIADTTGTIWEQYVHNGRDFTFPKGIAAAKGSAVTATLASVSTTGGSPDALASVNLHGATY
jgi:hypothetical protein